MSEQKISDLRAEQICQDECVKAFTKLSRHYCTLNDNDSVAVGQSERARLRALKWLVEFIQDKKYL